jgi:23S rRNA (cytidine1920-2'-O)/16S rRNA (cytidine1409-2'-O)-methyltransferase
MSCNDETRIDLLLVSRNLASSRTDAQRLIEAGMVAADGVLVIKSNKRVSVDIPISIKPIKGKTYVSRGGNKLEAALLAFAIDPSGLRCLDVGISTGGFTDCLLQAEAVHVTGVDVGHRQLHSKLAGNRKVDLHEGINARDLSFDTFSEQFPLIVVDLSFISLTYVIPNLTALLKPQGDLICLIKPQFEVGFGNLGKHGIVVDPILRYQARESVHNCAATSGLTVIASIQSPILGGDGNIEYLSHFTR